MCLAIPGRVLAHDGQEPTALVEVGGVRRRVNVELVEAGALAAGDWVLVHAGMVLRVLEPREAEEQLALLALLERASEEEARA